MRAWQLRDLRTGTVCFVVALAALAMIVPRVTLERTVFNVMAFVDITGSMKVRDMGTADVPVDRLSAAKTSVRTLLASLPCQSRLGLGIFTERRSFVLFNPVEVCQGYDPIDQAISNLDWRMGWEGDSFVATGLYHAIGETLPLNADILFLTEGQEAPPPPLALGTPSFEGEPGKVRGSIIGVGGNAKVPIPKFDEDGNEAGVYSEDEVVQENRAGPPPPDAASRPGYHPTWAPFGNEPPTGDEHLSSVRTDHLKSLAAKTGLGYAELKTEGSLIGPVERYARPRTVSAKVDIRPYPAALALALLTALFGVPLLKRVGKLFGSI